ncbi:MAG TPA: ArgR family transcriptional regulator [Bacteroidales bacterium]|nr:ArgR family transcriptional regulator [Bacteroidales bacterium]
MQKLCINMQKTKRLLAIEKIIREARISTQDELLKKLKGKGLSCTQATLSRNLRQLGVGRIPDGSGGYKYAMPDNARIAVESPMKLNIVPVIQEIIEAKGMMIIKTIPGNANNTALFIDNARRYEIAGTIAGDDTILLLPRDGISSHQLHSCLEIILPGLHARVGKK